MQKTVTVELKIGYIQYLFNKQMIEEGVGQFLSRCKFAYLNDEEVSLCSNQQARVKI